MMRCVRIRRHRQQRRLNYTPSRLILYTQFRLFCLFVEFFNPGNSRGNPLESPDS